MKSDRNWYVLYTKPNAQNKVVSQLSQRGLDAYCPYHSVQQKWQQQGRAAIMPLFNSYVFVQCTETELPYAKNIAGVINILYRLSTPAIVTPEDIATIRKVISTYGHLKAVMTGMIKNVRPMDGNNDEISYHLPSLCHTLVVLRSSEKVVSGKLVQFDRQHLSFSNFAQQKRESYHFFKNFLDLSGLRVRKFPTFLSRQVEQQ